jgi:hypothetical protein
MNEFALQLKFDTVKALYPNELAFLKLHKFYFMNKFPEYKYLDADKYSFAHIKHLQEMKLANSSVLLYDKTPFDNSYRNFSSRHILIKLSTLVEFFTEVVEYVVNHAAEYLDVIELWNLDQVSFYHVSLVLTAFEKLVA